MNTFEMIAHTLDEADAAASNADLETVKAKLEQLRALIGPEQLLTTGEAAALLSHADHRSAAFFNTQFLCESLGHTFAQGDEADEHRHRREHERDAQIGALPREARPEH